MMTHKQSSKGAVSVTVVAAPAGGYDVGSITVCGRDMPPTRKGEFETADEAETAAYALAAAFAKEIGIDPRTGND